MSTNYYEKRPFTRNERGEHIGKRWAAGAGKLGFIFAQDPEALRKRLLGPIMRRRFSVVDEYGTVMTGLEFTAVLDEIAPEHVSLSIGEHFS